MMGINIDDLTIEQYLRLISGKSNIKFNYDSEDMKLDKEVGYTTDEESVTSEHEALDPAHANDARSLDEELSSEEDLDEWLKGELEKHMNKIDDLSQQETLGTVKNASVKIDKFEFSCDFVVTDMPENLGEIIILGRPFLETTHTQIDVFQEEISLGIGKDRIKFGVNGNLRSSNSPIEKVYMANTSQEE
ncbi:RNA-directed DNA polymerase, eukaryota, reverse transcriptase zinc-binding domain protein [Tanacetum coccineum]